MLIIVNIFHSYNQKEDILKGINLDVSKGEIISILGGSGSGKTSFLRILSGLERPHTVSYTHLTLPTIYSV